MNEAAAAENYDELNDSSHLNLPSEASLSRANEYGATMCNAAPTNKHIQELFVIKEGTS
jgi:hypothetical protein